MVGKIWCHSIDISTVLVHPMRRPTYWFGTTYVDNDVVSSSSRTPIPRELCCTHEYQFRGAQDVVRYNVETDRGTITQDPDWIYDDVEFQPWIDPLCWTTQWSSGRKQRYMSTQIQSCVWRRCMIIQKRIRSGNSNPWLPTIQRVRSVIRNRWRTNWVWVEYFPRMHIKRSRKIWKFDKYIRNNLREEFHSCRCSTTLIGQRMEIHLLVFRISKKRRFTRKRFQRGNWSFFGPGNEEKWYGTFCHKQEGKCYNEANQMIEHLKQSGHPVLLEERHFTSQRNQQTLNFHFAQLTRQISSVSTEQYRVGVMTWLKRCLVRHPWQWTNPFQKLMICHRNNWIRKKLVLWYKPNEDRGSRSKQLTWSYTTIQDAGSRWKISCNPWISRIYRTSLCWNVLQKQWWCERLEI